MKKLILACFILFIGLCLNTSAQNTPSIDDCKTGHKQQLQRSNFDTLQPLSLTYNLFSENEQSLVKANYLLSQEQDLNRTDISIKKTWYYAWPDSLYVLSWTQTEMHNPDYYCKVVSKLKNLKQDYQLIDYAIKMEQPK